MTNDTIAVLSSSANTLVQGPKGETEAYVAMLASLSPPPVITMETSSDALMAIANGSVILENVARYTADQQRELLSWLDGSGAGVQLISTAYERLFDLVESGQFIEALYYRLNIVLVDFTSQLFLAFCALVLGR